MGGVWTKLKGSFLPNSDGDPTCPRCLLEPETLEHRLWSCSANAPFREWLHSNLSSPNVIDNLPPCTRRCGLFSRDSCALISDVIAIQSYLAGVNCHATDACIAFRQGMTCPSPAPLEPRRLDPSKIYDVALPPLKRRKVPSIALAVDLAAGDPAPVDSCFPQLDGSASASFPVSIRREKIPPDTLGLAGVSFDDPSQGDIVVSVDGSCLQVDDTLTSGWGFTALTAESSMLIDVSGPVVLAPLDLLYVGASRHTNNVGELTALVFALRWIASLVCRRIRILYDSEYAASLTRRLWRPSSNFSLVLAAREALDVLTAREISIDWIHLDSHTGHVLNERADVLAKFGARHGLRCSLPLLPGFFQAGGLSVAARSLLENP
jgi:ribonuclease HI